MALGNSEILSTAGSSCTSWRGMRPPPRARNKQWSEPRQHLKHRRGNAPPSEGVAKASRSQRVTSLLKTLGLPPTHRRKAPILPPPHPAPGGPPTLSSSSILSSTPNYTRNSNLTLPLPAWTSAHASASSLSLRLPTGAWLGVHPVLRIPFIM